MPIHSQDFETIMQSFSEVEAYLDGAHDPRAWRVHVPSEVDVKAIRLRFGLTQSAFAARFGFSQGAVRDWEQRRKTPEASARVLLKVIEHEPQAIERALAAG